MDLGHRVRDLRNARRLSQIELAAQASIARNTLNRIENGHLMPTAPVIEHLAEALGVDPGQLFAEPALTEEAEALSTSELHETPRMDRPGVQEWLREHGYVSREELYQWLEEDLDLDLDESGWPRGLQRAIHELRGDRDRLKREIDLHTDELFGPRNYAGLSTRKERT